MGTFKDIYLERFGGHDIKWLPQRIGWFKWGIDQTLVDRGCDIDTEMLGNLHLLSHEVVDYLSMLGVSKQSSYVIIKDLSKYHNNNTGERDVGGYASKQYIAIDYDSIVDYTDNMIELLIHEWAHKYFYNLSKEKKKQFEGVYNRIVMHGTMDNNRNLLMAIQEYAANRYKDNDLYYFKDKIINYFDRGLKSIYHDIRKEYSHAFDMNFLTRGNLDYGVDDIFNQIVYNLTFGFDNYVSRVIGEVTLKKDVLGYSKGDEVLLHELYDQNVLQTLDLFSNIDEWFDISTKQKKTTIDELSYFPEHGREKLYNPFYILYELNRRYSILDDISQDDMEELIWGTSILIDDIQYLHAEEKDVISIEDQMDDMTFKSFLNVFKTNPVLLFTLEILRIYDSDGDKHRNVTDLSGSQYKDIKTHKRINNIVPTAYSASNLDELWADGVTYFTSLANKDLKSEILKLLHK